MSKPAQLPTDAAAEHSDADFLAGGGEMGTLMRAMDWSRTGLGPIEHWPQALRTSVSTCLNSRFPILIWWGSELIKLYNDAYRPMLGQKHPRALGQRGRECWPEIWHIIGPMLEGVLARGEATWSENQLLLLERHGFPEECYFTFSYSPIRDASGIAGVFCAVTETTGHVLGERRLRMLRDLATRTAGAKSEKEAWRAALDGLAGNAEDLPFAALYRSVHDGRTLRLAGTVGSPSVEPPRTVELAGYNPSPWPLARATESGAPAAEADTLVLPVGRPATAAYGYLVAGLSPHRPLDHGYRDFLAMVADQLAGDIANARAHDEQSRMQRQLERERGQLARLFTQAPMPMAVLRGDELIFDMANPAYRAMAGGRELLGLPLREALPELATQELPQLMRDVMRTGQPHVGHDMPVKMLREGRLSDTFFTFIYAPLRGIDGVVDRVLVICTDVTDRVRARDAIDRSEARYRNIFQAVDVSIWEEDFSAVKELLDELAATGVQDLREHLAAHPEIVRCALELVKVIDVNDATLRLLAAKDKSEISGALGSILPPEAEAVFVDELIAIAEGRPYFQMDTALRTLQGEHRDVMLRIAFPRNDPALRNVLVTLTDITERKRMEQALRDSDRHKDEFLATLSHELRNPLAPLRNAVQLLRLEQAGESEPVLAMMERQVTHLVRLVDDLLEMSRISRGTFELRKEPVALAAMVSNAVETSMPLIEEAAHELEVSVPDEPLWLDGDPVRLAQILANLLNNAAKYTEPGGRISLEARREGSGVAIAVRDNGAGIRPEALPHLFEMFSRAGRIAGQRRGGLGIGLALARRLATMHGGSLEGRSEGVGKGSEFTLRLPLGQGAGKKAATGTEEPRTETGQRVLVVDDNRDAAESLRMVLEALGADVRVAHGGQEALATFEEFGPGVVLLDIGMPEMDGYEVARRMRARSAVARPLLVALTGWGQADDRRKARAAGFDHHLIKPVHLTVLRSVLRGEVPAGQSRPEPAGKTG